MRWKLLSLMLLLAAAPAATAKEPQTAAEVLYEKAIAAHVARLEALATWATKSGVYAARDEVLASLLRFAPEHAKARKRLKYKKIDGAWVQSERYKPPKNFKPKNLPEYEKRRAEVEAEHAADLGTAFAACKTPAELSWAANIAAAWRSARPEDAAPQAAVRRINMRRYQLLWAAGRVPELVEVAAALRADYPLDAEVRALLGEVARESDYILRETERALTRRPELQAAAKQALAEQPDPAGVELTKRDFSLGVTGLAAFETANIRVAGTLPEKELKAFASMLQAAGPFWKVAFGTPPDRRKTLGAYLWAKPDELDAFLARFPGIDPAFAEQQKQHGLHVFWANGNTLCAGPIQADAQRELCVGVLFMVFLADTWFGPESMPGWLDEGIGRHLAFLMTNTRFGISVGGRYAGKEPTVSRNVPDAHGNWLKSADARLKKLKSWDLRLVLGKGIDAYTANDSMIAYALGVFLIEALPDKVGAFLKRLGAGDDPDLAARKALGMPLAVVEHRLRRFVTEIAASR